MLACANYIIWLTLQFVNKVLKVKKKYWRFRVHKNSPAFSTFLIFKHCRFVDPEVCMLAVLEYAYGRPVCRTQKRQPVQGHICRP